MASPDGLWYYPNLLSREEHQCLLDTLTTTTGALTNHYGYKSYAAKTALTLADPIPDYLIPIITLIRKQSGLEYFDPDQAIINRYLPGEGIVKHIDHTKLFSDIVVSVTIGAEATMRFRSKTSSCYDQRVIPGSAYAMTGDARYTWTHEMVKSNEHSGTLYSITFREVDLDYLKPSFYTNVTTSLESKEP